MYKTAYVLKSPKIVSRLHADSELDIIVHKTADGDAYVYYDSVERFEGGTEVCVEKIGVIDQSWPD